MKTSMQHESSRISTAKQGAKGGSGKPDVTRGQPATRLLMGMVAIAEHLGIKRRQAYHLHEKRQTNQFPTFTMPDGRTVACRASSLDEWVDRCERGEIVGEEG